MSLKKLQEDKEVLIERNDELFETEPTEEILNEIKRNNNKIKNLNNKITFEQLKGEKIMTDTIEQQELLERKEISGEPVISREQQDRDDFLGYVRNPQTQIRRDKEGQSNTAVLTGPSPVSGAENLVPLTISEKIFQRIYDSGSLLKHLNIIKVKGNFAQIESNVLADAQWLPEGNAQRESSSGLTFKKYDIVLNYLSKTISLPIQINSMTNEVLEEYLVNEISKIMARSIESKVINSTTEKAMEGILSNADLSDTNNKLKFKKAEFGLKSYSRILGSVRGDKLCWVLHRETFFDTIFGATDKENRALFNNMIVGDPTTGFTLAGSPVLFSDALPLNTIVFIDLSKYVLNMPAELSLIVDPYTEKHNGIVEYQARIPIGGRFCADQLSGRIISLE